MVCVRPTTRRNILDRTFPDHFVTPEAKIRQLCNRLLAAENDEAAKRILQELREALHKNYERLRREVAREMERECRLHKDDMAAD
jgi:hypothetical protein